MGRAISPKVMDLLILGQGDRRRQLQEFPILGDVWSDLASRPAGSHDLLISPYFGVPAARVAAFVRASVGGSKEGQSARQISYLDQLVAARLTLDDICDSVIAGTSWWHKLMKAIVPFADAMRENLAKLTQLQLEFEVARETVPPDDRTHRDAEIEATLEARPHAMRQCIRLAVIIGLLKAAVAADAGDPILSLGDAREILGSEHIAKLGAETILSLQDTYAELRRAEALSPERRQTAIIYNVSANRPADYAVSRSVPAIKADAARRLFDIDCSELNWAVIDSGIDGSHPAFATPRKGSPKDRIIATYDFGSIRQILDVGNVFDGAARQALATELASNGIGDPQVNDALLLRLATKMEQEEDIDWGLVAPLIERKSPKTPTHPHGTHVAGILGGRWVEKAADGTEEIKLLGVCPDINFYDFRVLGSTAAQTEFAVVAALQFVQHINRLAGSRMIHGVNLSLSIPHNVRNYACGRTPVCEAANHLVDNGVVVVAAAGNHGYQRYSLADGGTFESYAPSSITDPGNAEKVITVGATHRFWPHTYGVSFFSSRGPTGDGRMKPDLVAPGERIESAVLNHGLDVLDGTSMAAPHVSGAAALLMARHLEFRNNPVRIKDYLCKGATDLGRERSFQGFGMVDVLRSIQDV